mgnify:CR=1 FL=1
METGHRLDYFTLKIFHGGVYFGPPEEKYVSGSMKSFEGVLTNGVSLNSLSALCTLLGYEGNVKLYYRILGRENEFKLCKNR